MKIKTYTAVILVILFLGSSGMSFELSETPINSMMITGLYNMNADNLEGFGSPGKTNEKDEDGFNKLEQTSANGGKKVWKAALYSAFVPGLGEYYSGHKTKAKYFFAVEALSWIGYISFRTYGNWKKDDMVKFAADYADASLEGTDDWFEDMVGFYDNTEEYNKRGRVDDPDRPYFPDAGVTHWSWDNAGDQETYRLFKNSYRDNYRRADFMIGLMIVNRIVSVIDAVRDVKRLQREVDADVLSGSGKIDYRFDIDPFNDDKLISFTVFKRF